MLKRKRSEKPLSKDPHSTEHHEKNPYFLKRPNFAELAKLQPNILGEFVAVNPISGKGTIDFANNMAAKALTQALLSQDFGVYVDIPDNHLCPPLPNRINYLCWLSDLIESRHDKKPKSTAPTRVLDIGVGPCAIYPILGHRLFDWDFVGTDVDAQSVTFCEFNLNKNPLLAGHIVVKLVEKSESLQNILVNSYIREISGSSTVRMNDIINSHESVHAAPIAPVGEMPHSGYGSLLGPVRMAESVLQSTGDGFNVTATMCNPPFYDLQELVQPSKHTICNGSQSEMHTTGGEVAFICAIIADSLILRDKIVWYTSMVGKFSSLKTLIAILQHEGISRENIVTTTLRQGVTHRWCLGWTFDASAAAQYRAYCAQRNLQRQDAQKRRTDIEMKEQEREEKKLKLEKQEGNVEAPETYNDEKASLSIYSHTCKVPVEDIKNTIVLSDSEALHIYNIDERVEQMKQAIISKSTDMDRISPKCAQHEVTDLTNAVVRVLVAIYSQQESSSKSTKRAQDQVTDIAIADAATTATTMGPETASDVTPDSEQILITVCCDEKVCKGSHDCCCGGGDCKDSGSGGGGSEDVFCTFVRIETSIGSDLARYDIYVKGAYAVVKSEYFTQPPHTLSPLIREYVHKKHDLFLANVLRTNRKWRRMLSKNIE